MQCNLQLLKFYKVPDTMASQYGLFIPFPELKFEVDKEIERNVDGSKQIKELQKKTWGSRTILYVVKKCQPRKGECQERFIRSRHPTFSFVINCCLHDQGIKTMVSHQQQKKKKKSEKQQVRRTFDIEQIDTSQTSLSIICSPSCFCISW